MSALTGPVGLASTVVLLVLLAARELVSTADRDTAKAVRRLDLAIVPLLLLFLVVVGARFWEAT